MTEITHNEFKFGISTYDDGFLAVSKVEPFFCLHAITEKEAIDLGRQALEFFLQFTGKKESKVQVSDQTKVERRSHSIQPSSIITAHAC